jgi:hypothetical protein
VGNAISASINRISKVVERAEIAGDRPDRGAEEAGGDHHQNSDLERDPAAVHDARQEVAAEMVGAEPVGCARRREPQPEIRAHWIVRCEHPCEACDHRGRADDAAAPVAPEWRRHRYLEEEAVKPVRDFTPIGTGPFKFGEYAPDSHITLERFDGYMPNPH